MALESPCFSPMSGLNEVFDWAKSLRISDLANVDVRLGAIGHDARSRRLARFPTETSLPNVSPNFPDLDAVTGDQWSLAVVECIHAGEWCGATRSDCAIRCGLRRSRYVHSRIGLHQYWRRHNFPVARCPPQHHTHQDLCSRNQPPDHHTHSMLGRRMRNRVEPEAHSRRGEKW